MYLLGNLTSAGTDILTLTSNNNQIQGLDIVDIRGNGIVIMGDSNTIGSDGDGVNDGAEHNYYGGVGVGAWSYHGNLTPTSFEVHEQGGGTSNLAILALTGYRPRHDRRFAKYLVAGLEWSYNAIMTKDKSTHRLVPWAVGWVLFSLGLALCGCKTAADLSSKVVFTPTPLASATSAPEMSVI